MNITKTLQLSLATVLIVFSCGKKESTDKKAELSDLKKQQKEISEKITTLEKEMGPAAADKPDSSKIKMVKVTEIMPMTFRHYVDIQGKIETDNNIMLGPETPGLLVRLNVKSGDKVKRGQLLAQVDNTLLKKGIDEIKSNLELATSVYEKQDKLWKDKVGTEVQYLQAKATKESLESRMASLKEQIKKTSIVSPMSGVIDAVNAKQGEMVSPQMPIFRIVDLTEFKVVGELAESYVSKVNEGDDVEVYFPDLDKTIQSKISVVGSTINTLNRTFTIEVKLKDTKNIKPNMIAYLKINDFTKKNALTVPLNTVQKSGNGQYVYVADGGKAVRKNVEVGGTYLNNALIKSGLNANDKVITFGYIEMTEGQAIKY